MTEWTLLKRLLDAVHQHSTMIGRLWLTVMVIFRLLIIAVAIEDVYADEQEMFVCNTLQPGCATVCYDAFAPISQPRFWVFHIISVSTPSLCFIIYTWHNLSKLPQGHGGLEAFNRSCDSDSCSIRSHRHLGHSLANVLEGITAQRGPGGGGGTRGVLSKYYVFHVCFRALLEVGFVMAQSFLFGFCVPVHFLCKAAPCTQPVDCYVSRPTEKTIFLLFMFCVGVFCILLNLLELNHLGWKKIKLSVRLKEGGSRGNYGTFAPDSPSLTSSLGLRDVTSTTLLPTLDLVVDHRPDWTCAGNCPPFNKEPEAGIETGLQLPNNQELQRAETQVLKSKGEGWESKLRSTEVWI
ncbi:gap junction protein delta 6 [Coregonus clupeaformis]|uniref:gap junction protein delta 6 n=1 Tax=Coregonus clupeaformis TaxID=59861 RepID=UPI001E1C9C87|nr:gap junction protein delta 6 [Coregonus clupeaformis]